MRLCVVVAGCVIVVFGVAQVSGDRQHLGRVDEFPRCGLPTLQFKSNDAAAGFLLRHRQLMLWVRWQAWIQHTRNRRLHFQPLRSASAFFECASIRMESVSMPFNITRH